MSDLWHRFSGPPVGIAARLLLSAFGALLVFGLDLTVASVTRAPFPAEVFRPETGHCRTVDLGPLRLGIPTDAEAVSALMVLEDGVPLPSAPAPHDDIRSKGEGRYSHW